MGEDRRDEYLFSLIIITIIRNIEALRAFVSNSSGLGVGKIFSAIFEFIGSRHS